MCEWEKDLSGLQKIVNFNNLNNLTPLRVEVEMKFDIFRLSSQSVNNIHNNQKSNKFIAVHCSKPPYNRIRVY